MSVLKVPVTSADHIQGAAKAKVTLVEYGDYECPYCGEAHPVIKKLQKHFGDNLRFVFRNFPLAEMHPLAKPAAEAAEFAGDRARFWEMHDLLYENQENFSIPFFLELGKSLKLPTKDLDLAIEQQTYDAKIQKDFMGGVRSGVNGTPTFFINDQRHSGAFDYDSLMRAIDESMA